MSHPKMQVVPGHWEDYLDALPKGSDFLGIVTTRQGNTGVLVKLWASGRYAMYTREGGRILDGRDVSAAMGTTGRPKLSEDSAAHSIRLTGSDAMIAEQIGGGNLSEGVRLALRAQAGGVLLDALKSARLHVLSTLCQAPDRSYEKDLAKIDAAIALLPDPQFVLAGGKLGAGEGNPVT